MDPEEQQGGTGAPDVATGDLDIVLAAAARGEYDGQADTQAQGGAQADAASEPAPQEQGAAVPEEATAETPTETPAEDQQKQGRKEPKGGYERGYYSVAGNLETLARQRQEEQRAFAEERRQFQQQQLTWQREREMAAEEAKIRATQPPEYADQAVQEFRENKQKEHQQAEFTSGAEAYRQYLLQQQQQVEEAKVDVFRASLPQVFPELARYVAEQFQAPEEDLVALAGTEAMAEVYQMVGRAPAKGVSLAQRDLDLVSAVMAAQAQVGAKRDVARKQANATGAAAAGTFRGAPDGTSRGSGVSEVERIKTMPDKDFDAMLAQLRAKHGA